MIRDGYLLSILVIRERVDAAALIGHFGYKNMFIAAPREIHEATRMVVHRVIGKLLVL